MEQAERSAVRELLREHYAEMKAAGCRVEIVVVSPLGDPVSVVGHGVWESKSRRAESWNWWRKGSLYGVFRCKWLALKGSGKGGLVVTA